MTRDFSDFWTIFYHLSLTNYIKYGTFKDLCNTLISRRISVRDSIISLFKDEAISSTNITEISRPSVLLIDEVDVFFSDNFYGSLYYPVA